MPWWCKEAILEFPRINQLIAAYAQTPVSTEIHPDDVMYNTGKPFYFTVGSSAIAIIMSGLSLSWLGEVKNVLDLPCGHGRVARHLRAAFPQAPLYVCDLDHSGVDFCANTFKAVGIYSQPDLRSVSLPSGMDLIWIGSLFTHVDRARTASWLSYLAGHLSQHGILVATFHGLFFRELSKTMPVGGGVDWPAVLSQYDATGYGYAEYTTLGTEGYGVSLSKASVILDIATSIPETRVLAYTERGWANNHDVLILTRNDRLKSFS